MDKLDYVRIPINSNYIKFQNETIRRNKRLIKGLIFCLIALYLLAFYVTIEMYKINVELVNKVEKQEIMIESYEQQIESLRQDVERLEKENYNLTNKYEETVINAIKKLTGNIVDKTIDVVYLEAGNQGKTGMQLVADVIFNRQASDRFAADSVKEVLSSPRQFNALYYMDRINDDVRESENYKIAQEVVYDKLLYETSLTNEALFFMNPEIARGSWDGKRELILKHKNHAFYK